MSRVEVYRNLHAGTWSVRDLELGRVVAHPKMVSIRDATLVVQPAGNNKVRDTGRKNVHAFVRGEAWFSDGSLTKLVARILKAEGYRKASYNPYENTLFVDKETGEAVVKAAHVVLDIHTGVWYTDDNDNNNNEVN